MSEEQKPSSEMTEEELDAYLDEHFAAPIDALTPEAVHELAVKIITNVVYCAQLGSEECTLSFGAILALTPNEIIPRNLAGLYCEMSQAMPMAVNGRPVFLSAQWIPAESMQDIGIELDRLQQAMR